MFDTMTMTKVLGGVCGTFLVFLLGGWAAEAIYNSGEGGHGEEHAMAYVISTESHGDEAVEEGPSFEEIYATADAGAGANVFRKCASCHSTDAGVNGTGPSLHGVVGRAAGTEAGFEYSANVAAVGEWTPEHLNTFLTSPKAFVSGTKMSFNGLAKIEDRANLIAYLATMN